MEVMVAETPTATLRLDYGKFKQDFKASLDLKKSFMRHTHIVEHSSTFGKNDILEFVYLSLNWGKIVGTLNLATDSPKMIHLFMCTIKDFVKYTPGTIDAKKRVIHFNENKVASDDLLIVHTMVPIPNHHLEELLAKHLFDYTETRWETFFSL